MATDNFEKRTRSTFHAIHAAQLDNPAQLTRTNFVNSPEFIGVAEDFFAGKVCLEAGCGSYAPGAKHMIAGGAKKVWGLELGDEILSLAADVVEDWGSKFEFKTGSVLDIPFGDASFDFALCGGVLHHTSSPLTGLRELCRVIKPGGSLFVSTQGAGGFMKAVTNAAHELYQTDPDWRKFIDELSPDMFSEIIRWTTSQMRAHGDRVGAEMVSESAVHKLFDQDLVLTIFDRVKAPAYNNIQESDLLAVFDEFGFDERRRVSHFHQFENVRRFLAPMYNAPQSPLAKLMYGDGILEYFATKRL